MSNDKQICPYCKSVNHTNIHASGSEYASLFSHDLGGVYLTACLDCGGVYLSKYHLDRIQRNKDKRGKK